MNYKILQDTFDKNKINKHIEVQKLIKAKPLDNIEFLQWLKKFYDTHITCTDYDAIAKRNGINPPGISGNNKINLKLQGNNKRRNSEEIKHNNKRLENKENIPINIKNNYTNLKNEVKSNDENRLLTMKLEEFQVKFDNLEKERDFYFSKLRDIEIYLQAQPKEEQNITKNVITKLLYATVDENATVDDNGNLYLNGSLINPETLPDAYENLVEPEDAIIDDEIVNM